MKLNIYIFYLWGTIDIDLFYSNNINHKLVVYTDARYLSDPHKSWSQTSYLFKCGNISISWKYIKQILVVTWSNLVEILAINETSWEYIWLRCLTPYICKTWGLSSNWETPVISYEDNVACITQLKNNTSREIEQNTYHQNSFHTWTR